MENEAYRQIVLSIYQAVSDPGHWVNVMDMISDLVSARGGVILEMQPRGDEVFLETPLMTSNYDPAAVQEYFERHRAAETHDHKIFDRRLLKCDGIDVLDEAILYESREAYLQRPHVQELTKLGVAHRTGALLDKDNPFRARFSLSMGRRRGPFNDEEVALLKDILPHVAKALELARPVGTLDQAQRTLLALLEYLDVGVCLVDAEGRIVEYNSEFRRQREEYGAFKPDHRGRLQLPSPENRAQLAILLADALNHAKFGARPRKEAILVKVQSSETPLCVEVLPLPRSKALGSRDFNGALVISRDSSTPVEFDVNLAKAVFELSATEASVLELVSHGLTNREIADQRERSVETINAQLKSILQKTGTPNRTQLVRLLCNFSGSKPDQEP